ncbi:MAG: type III-A CRISPR-associated protein Csm2, partial [Desulfobulbus sp.]|nr:type III-A CRISPR-associated protein Csm2 [Desulfobulbus sp.]
TMTWGIDAVLEGDSETETQRFNHFCKLFEAVLAYHRAHGGK